MTTGNSGNSGAPAGAPATLFETDDDERMLADAQPFTVQPRGGSRKGRPNKRTDKMRDLYLRMGLPHPMLWQGQVLAMKVETLAAELGCDKAVALEVQRKIAADLAPFIESKMPTALVDDKGDALPMLLIGDVVAATRQLRRELDDGSLSIDDEAVQHIEQDQGLKRDGG